MRPLFKIQDGNVFIKSTAATRDMLTVGQLPDYIYIRRALGHYELKTDQAMSQHPIYTAVVLAAEAEVHDAKGNAAETAKNWRHRLWKFSGWDKKTRLPKVVPLDVGNDYGNVAGRAIVYCKLATYGKVGQQVSAQIKGMVEVEAHKKDGGTIETVPECFHDYSPSAHSSMLVLV